MAQCEAMTWNYSLETLAPPVFNHHRKRTSEKPSCTETTFVGPGTINKTSQKLPAIFYGAFKNIWAIELLRIKGLL